MSCFKESSYKGLLALVSLLVRKNWRTIKMKKGFFYYRLQLQLAHHCSDIGCFDCKDLKEPNKMCTFFLLSKQFKLFL